MSLLFASLKPYPRASTSFPFFITATAPPGIPYFDTSPVIVVSYDATADDGPRPTAGGLASQLENRSASHFACCDCVESHVLPNANTAYRRGLRPDIDNPGPAGGSPVP